MLPHDRYLRFLLSKGLSVFDVMRMCVEDSLTRPSEDHLTFLAASMGDRPKRIPKNRPREGTKFYRWVQANGIYAFWAADDVVAQAVAFLKSGSVRDVFETTYLATRDVEKAREAALSRFPAVMVPSPEALSLFQRWFWEVENLPWDCLREFILDHKRAREMVPALEGDLVETYALLGLKHQVDAVDLYNSIISFTYQQVNQARRSGEEPSAHRLMGLAAMSRQAMDALSARDDANLGPEAEAAASIRHQAMQFRLGQTELPSITSIDDINVVDVEVPDVLRLASSNE